MTGHRLEWMTRRSRGQFAELLKVQAKLALREPLALFGGLALPAVLLAVFGFIGQANPGNVGDSGLTVIEVWTPTILVLSITHSSRFPFRTLWLEIVRSAWLRRVSTTPASSQAACRAAGHRSDSCDAAVLIIVILEGRARVRHHTPQCRFCPLLFRYPARDRFELFAFGLVLVALGADTNGRT